MIVGITALPPAPAPVMNQFYKAVMKILLRIRVHYKMLDNVRNCPKIGMRKQGSFFTSEI